MTLYEISWVMKCTCKTNNIQQLKCLQLHQKILKLLSGRKRPTVANLPKECFFSTLPSRKLLTLTRHGKLHKWKMMFNFDCFFCVNLNTLFYIVSVWSDINLAYHDKHVQNGVCFLREMISFVPVIVYLMKNKVRFGRNVTNRLTIQKIHHS